MTYQGQMQNGVIVFPTAVPITEGTTVHVSPRKIIPLTNSNSEFIPTLLERMKDIVGKAQSLSQDDQPVVNLKQLYDDFLLQQTTQPVNGTTIAEDYRDLIDTAADLPEDFALNHGHYVRGEPRI